MERTISLLGENSKTSMIVPISLIGNDRMERAFDLLLKRKSAWISSYSGDTHPGTLFSGVQQNLCIYILSNTTAGYYSTQFLRFYDSTEERKSLFTGTIRYYENIHENYRLKVGNLRQFEIFEKILKDRSIQNNLTSPRVEIFYHDVAHYWIKAFENAPYFKRAHEAPSVSNHYKTLFCDKGEAKVYIAILSSSLFYLWYTSIANGRDITKTVPLRFPFDISSIEKELKDQLRASGKSFVTDIERNKKRVVYNKGSGCVEYDQYWITSSKPIIDEIDKVLAKHYGFTEEELDFIINYDIKYRMGDGLNREE